MRGILLLSHGMMAEGLLDSAKLFFGELKQAAALVLKEDDDLDEFRKRLKGLLGELDTGEGVLIMVDLFGGTPCNCVIPLLNDRIQCIAGMNLIMLMEFLTERESGEIIPEKLASVGKKGILCVEPLQDVLDDDDF